MCVCIYLHCSAYCHACPGLHPVNYACISIDTKSCVVVSTFLFLSSSLLPLTLPSSLSLPLFLTPPPHSPFLTLPSSLPHSSPSLSLPLFLTPPPHSPFLTLPSSLPHSLPYSSLSSSLSLFLQFPQHYSAITETNQPAELIPQFSTIEYQLQVCRGDYALWHEYTMGVCIS